MALKILVVDDEPLVRETIATMLEHLGIGYEMAEDGDTALDAIKARKPDIALIDLVLPGSIDGLGLIATIMDNHPSTKIIAMSGDNSSDTYFRALRMRKVTHTLTKPIGLDDLSKAISAVTGLNIEDIGEDIIG